MDYRTTRSNILIAFLAQGTSMVLSVLQSLLIPKMMGVAEFGYWQLFLFYTSYAGLFQLGINDGVYLLHGGETRSEIDKREVCSLFCAGLLVEATFAVLLFVCGYFTYAEYQRRFVFLMNSVYIVLINSAAYLMFVLQAMNETKKSSYATIVMRVSFFIPLVCFLLQGIDRFQYYVVAYTASALLQLIFCIWNCRDIMVAGLCSPNEIHAFFMRAVRVGVKLMFANIASQLILGLFRYSIDLKWGIEAFGRLSLCLSLVSFFLAFVTQAAMVLFPALRQSSELEVIHFYKIIWNKLNQFLPLIYLLYFPLILLLRLWLPAYSDSLYYIIWLLPICVYDSRMSILCTTIFKVRRQESVLLLINLCTTVFCGILVYISVWVLQSIDYALIAAMLSIICRSIVSESIVAKDMGIRTNLNSLLLVVLTVVYLITSSTMYPFISAIIVVVSYVVYLYIQYSCSTFRKGDIA